MLADVFVGRTHDLAAACNFLQTVRTPSGDSRDGENRRVEFDRKSEHAVGESAEEVDIRADTFIDLALGGNDLRGKTFHCRVECEFFFIALFCGDTLYESAEDLCTRIGQLIDRVSHTVDQTGVIERFLVEQGSQVTADLLLIRPVLEIGFHIVEHAHHLDVGTAVLGTFEGT